MAPRYPRSESDRRLSDRGIDANTVNSLVTHPSVDDPGYVWDMGYASEWALAVLVQIWFCENSSNLGSIASVLTLGFGRA